MALTANVATVQILDDSSSHVIVKLHLSQLSAGANAETDTLKVNVNSLVGRTMTLTTTAAPTLGFIPGETISNGAVVGYVSDWNYNTNVARVVLANSAAKFANSMVITGGRGGTATLKADGAVMDAPLLALKSLLWSVSGNTSTRVVLQWEGNPNTEIFSMGVGSGYVGRNVLSTQIPNDANAATGSILATTYHVPALGGYSIILECNKVQGFDTRPIG